VQPLRQMNGHASFNQVFFTDAKVEPEFLVSEVGDGWAVTIIGEPLDDQQAA
jgi:alkylation response protein AidB-like acyl-CoA dehydrogenase